MYQFRLQKPRINKQLSQILWISAISVLLAIVLGYFPFQHPSYYLEISNLVNSTYNAFYRSCWAIALSWIIFSCQNGDGGIVRDFLSLQIFKPLSRMSLSVYLTHRVYQLISVATMKQPTYLNPLDLVCVYFSDVVVSIIIGVVVYLSVEAPFATLKEQLVKRTFIEK